MINYHIQEMGNIMIRTKKRGTLIVISAPSGAGKGTVISNLLEKENNLWLSVSATSRAPRTNDIEGETYYFYSKEEFENKIKEGYFLEYAEYAGNYYGTPKKIIEEKLNEGIDVILEIEIQGAMQIKNLIPESIFIFIMPPTLEELKRRLVGRNTDSKEKIIERFKIAYKEINEVSKYNYVVVNDEVNNAVRKIQAIIKAEKCRVDRIEEVLLSNEEEYIHELLVDLEQ